MSDNMGGAIVAGGLALGGLASALSSCSDSCCVGISSGPSESERHAKKVAEELAKMKERSADSSKKTTEKIMKFINQSLDAFLAEVQSINQDSYYGERLNINVGAIRTKNDQLSQKVSNCISSVMNRRLVQTDKELSVILGEKDDNKRNANFALFYKKLQRQAIKKLSEEINTTVNAQLQVVSTEIETRRSEINNRVEESVREISEIMDLKKKSETELKQKQLGYMYSSALCDLLLAEAEG